MLNKISSIRPTIWAGVVVFAALSLAACSPVAIMMPQPDTQNESALQKPDTFTSGAENLFVMQPGYYVRAPGFEAAAPQEMAPGYYVRAPGFEAATPQEMAPGYYVRAPGFTAAAPVTGEIDVAATPYLRSFPGQIDVAATPYLRSSGLAAEGTAALEAAPGALLLLLKVAADPKLGNILVDGDGMTLYMFTKDEPDKSNCAGGCLDAWPPLLALDNPAVGEGVDASLLGTAALADGSLIVTYNHMPLYFWQDDMQPGDTKGQGVNDVWFVVSPDGEPLGM